MWTPEVSEAFRPGKYYSTVTDRRTVCDASGLSWELMQAIGREDFECTCFLPRFETLNFGVVIAECG